MDFNKSENILNKKKIGDIFIFFWLLLFSFLLFSTSFYNLDFFWDDEHFIFFNPDIVFAPGWTSFWNHPVGSFKSWPLGYSIFWALTKHAPFQSITFYKCLNIIFHSLNSFLIYRILKKFKFKEPLLLVLLFLAHPLHVEAVSWVFQLLTILSFAFLIICFDLLLKYLNSNKVKYLWPSYLLFFFSLSTKSIGILFPFFFILIFWGFNQPFKRYILLFPFFLISLTSGLVNLKGVDFLLINKNIAYERSSHIDYVHVIHSAQGKAKQLDREYIQFIREQNLPSLKTPKSLVFNRAQTFSQAIFHYFTKLFVPFPLKFIYPNFVINLFFSGLFLTVIFFVLLKSYFKNKQKKHILLAGYVFCSLLPYLGIVYLPFFYWSNVSDRYAYFFVGALPFIFGLIVRKNKIGKQLLISYLLVLISLNFYHGQKFNNPEKIYLEVLADKPHPKIYNILFEEYLYKLKVSEAEKLLREGLYLFPQSQLLKADIKKLEMLKENLKN